MAGTTSNVGNGHTTVVNSGTAANIARKLHYCRNSTFFSHRKANARLKGDEAQTYETMLLRFHIALCCNGNKSWYNAGTNHAADISLMRC